MVILPKTEANGEALTVNRDAISPHTFGLTSDILSHVHAEPTVTIDAYLLTKSNSWIPPRGLDRLLGPSNPEKLVFSMFNE